MRAHSSIIFRAAAVVSILCIIIFSPASADNIQKSRQFGISASVQGGQFDIMVPYWESEKIAFVPAISFVHISDAANDIGLGLGFRVALKDGRSCPYVGARLATLIYDPEQGSTQSDLIVGTYIGGEYFLYNKLSVGVEAQVNITKSDDSSVRFGNPGGTNINTATAVMATFYF